jgi:hypothetical protein
MLVHGSELLSPPTESAAMLATASARYAAAQTRQRRRFVRAPR